MLCPDRDGDGLAPRPLPGDLCRQRLDVDDDLDVVHRLGHVRCPPAPMMTATRGLKHARSPIRTTCSHAFAITEAGSSSTALSAGAASTLISRASFGTGSGTPTMPTTRSPGRDRPTASWPKTSRSSPSGGQPYPSPTISRSVPQIPTVEVCASTSLPVGGGSRSPSVPSTLGDRAPPATSADCATDGDPSDGDRCGCLHRLLDLSIRRTARVHAMTGLS